jgi:hypothetical protein
METTLEVDVLIESLINSYETQISSIEAVIDKSDAITESSFDLLNDFSSSLKNFRSERDIVNTQLRENLAKNGSLRKKDYNKMMEDILNMLDEKEREAGEYFYQYINFQKNMVKSMKKGILEIKDYIEQDNFDKIKAFRSELNKITQELESKKETVLQQFIEYQKTHQKIVESFKTLLTKGDKILVNDLKEVHRKLCNEIS